MIICEDFNVDLFEVPDANSLSSMFYTTNTSLSLLPVNYRPTRFSGTSPTLADNVFVPSRNIFISGIFTIENTYCFPALLVYDSYLQKNALLSKKV